MQISKLFLYAIQKPEPQIDLGYCALLVSQAIQPGLDIAPFQQKLQALRTEILLAKIADGKELLELLSENQRFTGNKDDYYTVENSLLDKVLTNRTGIPISLALIYICAGNSPELSVYGISFPGHFLVGVKKNGDDSVTLIDPFAPQMVTQNQCYKMIEKMYQRTVTPDSSYFEPAGNRRILLRLIENIKGVYLQSGMAELALTCLDHQLMIAPEDQGFLSQQQQLLEHIKKSGGDAPAVH